MSAPAELLREPAKPARLAALLPRWLELPVYRARLRRNGNHRSGIAAVPDFSDIPFITKRDMRDGFPRNFLRAGQALEKMIERSEVEVEHTSGTSEERTPVLLGHGWWEAQETRALRLNRWVARVLEERRPSRRVVLTTPACNGTACHSRWTPRSARIDGAALSVNQARIPFLLDESELARMADETGEWSPQFLDLDPVHGAWFALYCERQGIRFPSLRFILCSYEFVSVVHRRILERVFGVPVLNLYGSTETGHLLMEDERGALQPSLDTAFLEVVDTDVCGVGDLVATTLSNDYMPLLRYRIGDLVERREASSAATYVVHGRARDALRTPAGRRVTTWQVDQCFTGMNGIAHYQLQQAETGDCRLRYVPDGAGPNASDLLKLKSKLEDILQTPGRIATQAIDLLVPAPSGKFRLTCRA